MDAARFDRLTRSLGAPSSRRTVLAGLASLGLGAGRVPAPTTAKRRRKKLRVNQFGCVNVGGKCRGKDRVCCSGICGGKKPKSGKRDRRRCQPHDMGGCRAGQNITECGGTADVECTTSSGVLGDCFTTTGDAGFCGVGGACFACKKDADCRPFCGPDAACVRCVGECAATACVGTGNGSCSFPAP